ncbi:MAG: hypothetical protein WKG00_06620 [Polyangiaceae bacterium]
MDSPPLPSWAPPATRALAQAAQTARVISSCTPLEFRDELERLTEDWERGDVRVPRFSYQPPEPRETVRRALGEMAEALDGRGALGGLFAARAREIAVEVEICAAAGTTALRDAALRRFGVRDAFDRRADDLALSWLDEPAPGFILPWCAATTRTTRAPCCAACATRWGRGGCRCASSSRGTWPRWRRWATAWCMWSPGGC